MKIKFMPKMAVALLCVSAIFGGMMMPATAASPTEIYGPLVRYEGASVSIEPIADEVELNGAQEDQESEEATARAIISEGVRPLQVTAYPLVLCAEDGILYYFDEIYATHVWATSSQFESLRLTNAQKNALNANVLGATAGLNDGRTYSVYGWRLVAVVEVAVNRPRYVEWTPSATGLNGTEMRKQSIPTPCLLTFDESFGLPASITPETTSYYQIGCYGELYKYYPNGTNGSHEFSFGLAVNTNILNK